MLVSISDQVTRRKFSRREAKQLMPVMFTRAQAAATGSTTPRSVTTSLQHTTASVTSGSTTHTSAASDVAPSVSVTITAVATTVSENGILLSSAASTPVLDTPTITSFVLNSLEGVHSGVPTRTTPTLTPTTLRNIEQTFLELSTVPQPQETHTNQAGFVPPLIHPSSGSTFVSVDNKCWGGGTLTQVANTSSSSSSSSSGVLVPRSAPSSLASHGATSTFSTLSSLSSLSSLTMPSQVQQPPRRTGGRRPIKDERLSAEEEDRKCMRRERNKMAAARCRKRRMDQTNLLQDETDDLEDRKSELQNEIQLLQQQRDELEFLLATHKAVCRRRLHNATPVTTAAANVVPAPQALAAPPALIASPSVTHVRVKSVPVMVKEEPIEEDECEDERQIRGGVRPRRPTSLNVAPVVFHTPSVADLGVPIETPSAGLRGLNFESMMDGGTGLTPVSSGTGLTPLHTGLTPLTTPVVTAPTASASSNCGTQQRSSSSDLSSPDSVPPKLVSL